MTTINKFYDSLVQCGKNISKSELAEILGITKSAISMRFKKNTEISLSEIQKIEKAIDSHYYEVSVDSRHSSIMKVLDRLNIHPKQRELAEIINVNVNTISVRASRNSEYSLSEIKLIEQYYQIDLMVEMLKSNLLLNSPTADLSNSMVCENIKNIINKLNLTIFDLSIKTGYSKITIENYISGQSIIPLNFAISLFKEYNINLNWLVTGEGNMFNAPEFDEVKTEIESQVEAILKKKGII